MSTPMPRRAGRAPLDLATVEHGVAQLCRRRQAVFVGHGTTAIYLALAAIKRARGPGEVILSPLVCCVVPQAVIYAGMTPVFADVALPDCTVDPESVAKLINDRTRAILAVHLFGNSADMERLMALGRSARVAVIENAAQSMGGQFQGRPHGAYGDFTVTSFGEGKVLSAGAGGALLTDDLEIATWVRTAAAAMPPFIDDEAYRLKSLSHRNLHHACFDLLRVVPDAAVAPAFMSMVEHHRGLYLHSFPSEHVLLERIDDALAGLSANVERRCRRAAQYDQIFAAYAPEVMLVSRPAASGVVWRYTVLIRECAKLLMLTTALRRAGIHASNHYYSTAQLMFDRRDLVLADEASPRLLNLWVDDSADDAYIERTREVVTSVLS